MSVPMDEVGRLLEKQRLMYEAKLKNLVRQPQNSNQGRQRDTTAASTSSQATAPTIPSQHRPTRSNQSPFLPTRMPPFFESPFYPDSYMAQYYRQTPIPSLLNSTFQHWTNANSRHLSRGNQPTAFNKYTRSVSATRHDSSGQSVFTKKKFLNRRDRSESRSRPKPNPEDDEKLNCKTCKKKYGVNIFQCGRGHSSCKECKLKDAVCGVCGQGITETRNIALEAYISEINITCPNADEGCCLYFKGSQMEAHIKECPFKVIACPVAALFGNCTWKGKVSQMAAHFDSDHPEHRQGAVDTEMVIPNITTNTTSLHLIQIGPYNFLIYIKVDEKESNVCMTVQLMGTTVSAAKWTYEIHIYAKNGITKYQFTDICHSNIRSMEEIFKKAKCLSIPLWYAMNFADNGCLAYKFYLKRGFVRNRWWK